MKVKSKQEVRGKQRRDIILWCVVLFIIIAAIVYFARMHPAQAIEEAMGSCWTYPVIQQSYVEPLIDSQQFVVEDRGFDGCHQRYFVLNQDEVCCKVGGLIMPVAFADDYRSPTDTRVWWFCNLQDISLGPNNGQLILFDTDVYVGFLPDPTCYEP